ncbi:DUF6480 family protein [Kitasatospora purpeofusca]|uniref:DUF6480 family protein n=1 Tax=Kitasatospora purpeofusca TaxID=67352 RepID=UPI002A5A6F0D|nr:DUF6480 family protein [Kitasatospora purpeofusca]MDY0810629.1 DUF6480 family protein [Kitasatospora purpeofusca]
MTTPDPDPATSPGTDHRGNTLPHDTPPAEGGIFGISTPEPEELRHAWGSWPAWLIILLAVAVSVMLIAMIVALSS